MNRIIAIDGPAGAGKSTIARKLAQRFNYNYLDTGAMYRAVTYIALKNKVDINNDNKLKKLVKNLKMDFLATNTNKKTRILVDGQDITENIRSDKVNKYVSEVAKIKNVRDELVKQQRHIALKKDIVIDGRDIGTRVFPDADFKFFLNASLTERAKRRYLELKTTDPHLNLKQIEKDLKKRDQIDRQRQYSPLRKAQDAVEIDTTNLNIKEVIIKISDFIKGE